MNNDGKTVGLQIGGTVGPNDKVGMHVPIPVAPSVGVKVQLGDELDNAAKEVAANIPDNHPKAVEVRKIVDEILLEKDKESKLKKTQKLVIIGAGITQIAVGIGKITKLLGF
ncbi:hypothetical protein KKF38_03060 [Patescibacteria group bacterium]|nr:hypothetical protein [Patescibacteria group bacterium]